MSEAFEGTIAVVGGSGDLGSAIARRLAKAGRKVIIGSRAAESAVAAAERLGFGLTGMANADAAAAADLVIVTVPFAAQDATLGSIAAQVQGKIVVDTTVPLVPPRVLVLEQGEPPHRGGAGARLRTTGPACRRAGQFGRGGSHDLDPHLHEQDLCR